MAGKALWCLSFVYFFLNHTRLPRSFEFLRTGCASRIEGLDGLGYLIAMVHMNTNGTMKIWYFLWDGFG